MKKLLVDMFIKSSLGNNDVGEELNKSLVLLDAREDVSWNDSLATLFLGLYGGQIQDFLCQNLEDRGEEDWSLG